MMFPMNSNGNLSIPRHRIQEGLVMGSSLEARKLVVFVGELIDQHLKFGCSRFTTVHGPNGPFTQPGYQFFGGMVLCKNTCFVVSEINSSFYRLPSKMDVNEYIVAARCL